MRVERRGVSDWNQLRLTIADAAALLREPVHLVFENRRTETQFLVMLAGPTNGQILRDLLDEPGRVELHGGGGGEAKRWLEELIQAAPTSILWRRTLRTWVLFDKDVGNSDVRDFSSTANSLIEACENVMTVYGPVLSWMCLCRREIESYVPDNGLVAEGLASHQDILNQVIAWRANAAQTELAWSFDLKKGLRGDLLPSLSAAVRQEVKERKTPLAAAMLKAPFNGLSAADVARLENGLGERLAQAYRGQPTRAWAADVPQEYDRGPSYQAPRSSLIQSLLDRM